MVGLRTFHQEIVGSGSGAIRTVFSFVVPQGLAEKAADFQRKRVEDVKERIRACGSSLTLAVVDSSRISGWDPSSEKWPVFRSNLELFMRCCVAAGGAGHHLEADDLEGLQARFEEIGAMMADPGLDEHL